MNTIRCGRCGEQVPWDFRKCPACGVHRVTSQEELRSSAIRFPVIVQPPTPRYLQLVGPIKEAKRSGDLRTAERLCLEAIESAEAEVRASSRPRGPPPWYYIQLAIVYRKQKRFADEVAVLERFERLIAPVALRPGRAGERLVKARKLLAESRTKPPPPGNP